MLLPLPEAVPIHSGFRGLIGESAEMHRLYTVIAQIRQNSSPVLLLGDTGTGKELVACSIHSSGSRCKKPLVPIDCSSLTLTLIESELFGYVKGAFTGADHSKFGLIQAANQGTIFLDEVAELPLCLQVKLLRVLQEKDIRPLGSTDRIPIDVRVIAAASRGLEAAVREGTFRQDLYYRLNVIKIRLPTLRDRKVDIPLLVAHFLDKFCDPLQVIRAISDKALRGLMAYDWPGNVRELENTIESAVALSSHRVLTPK